VVVTDADGAVEVAFAAPGSQMRRMLGRVLRSHLDLARRWPSLVRRYRAALPRHTTAAAWTAMLSAESAGSPTERT
jgi:hypothetical protein